MRVKDFTTKVGSGVTPRGGAEVYQDHGVPLFRSQNVTNDGFLLDDIAYISEKIDESMSGTRVKPNDVLLNITGASIGRCYYTPTYFERGNVNQHVCIIRPTKKVIAPYLYYNLISDNGQRQIDLTQTGSNREGLTKENICNFEFEIPSLDTQCRIVSYLDSHVSSIDKRVSLLTIKRDHYLRLKTAIINRAVTQGLNPDVKMKDSGVEWIGMIPEHWEIMRINQSILSITTGLNPRDNFKLNEGDCDFYYVTIRNFKEGKLYLDDNCDKVDSNAWKEIQQRSAIKAGDILFASISETPQAYIVKNFPYNWNINESVFSIRVNKKLYNTLYFYRLLTCPLFYNYLRAQASGSTFKSIKQYSLLHQSIIMPPLSEQQAIASYLDEKCAKIDAIVENLNQQIEKHKLLKRALINEVIAGQRAV